MIKGEICKFIEMFLRDISRKLFESQRVCKQSDSVRRYCTGTVHLTCWQKDQKKMDYDRTGTFGAVRSAGTGNVVYV